MVISQMNQACIPSIPLIIPEAMNIPSSMVWTIRISRLIQRTSW